MIPNVTVVSPCSFFVRNSFGLTQSAYYTDKYFSNKGSLQGASGELVARELAMERMQTEAEHLQAEGIVGVDIHEGNYSWSSNVIEFFVVGTAIVPMRQDHHISTPQLVLSLND